MSQTVHVRVSRQDVRDAVARAIAAVTGKGPDEGGHGRALALAVGVEALSFIKADFLVRSKGVTDASGLKWDPLKPATIAARRPPSQKRRGERPRGLLTAAQDARWRKLYSAALRWMRGDKGHAAAYAWSILKAEGARTRLAELGGRSVEILRDTGRLFNSLSPGTEGNVLNAQPGEVVVGTNVAYAAKLHAKRPLWAPPETWPDAYHERLAKIARDGLEYMVAQNIGRAG